MQLYIVWLILRRDIGYIWWFAVLAGFNGVFNLLPSYPYSATWKHWIQTPVLMVSLALTILATLEIFAFMRRRTFPQERALLLAWGIVLAATPVMVAWIWTPANWYQAMMILRQYALIGLTSGYCGAWLWVTWMRPLRIERQIEEHGNLWLAWLAASSVLSSTTTGGLFWLFSPRDEWTWKFVTGLGLCAQCWTCAGVMLNLKSWRTVLAEIPDDIPDPQVPEPFRLHHRWNP
jgi:hypothetical protein